MSAEPCFSFSEFSTSTESLNTCHVLLFSISFVNCAISLFQARNRFSFAYQGLELLYAAAGLMNVHLFFLNAAGLMNDHLFFLNAARLLYLHCCWISGHYCRMVKNCSSIAVVN